MNLALIKKYEKEFLHVLHGGNILVKCTDKLNVSHKDYLDWHCDSDVFESNLDYLIVIDDIYCTYRKALAEGKIVQYKGLSTQTWCTIQPELGHTFGVIHVSNYRIKPEEPKFKVDDWVIELRPDVDDYCYRKPLGRPFQIKEVVKGNTGWLYKKEKDNYSRELFENNLSAWEPKEGEICIFWDSVDTSTVISKFSHMEQEKYSTDLHTWNNCMPFTGALPPHMKDNK